MSMAETTVASPTITESSTAAASPSAPSPSAPSAAPAAAAVDVLPGMPPVVDPTNIYSEAGANMLGAGRPAVQAVRLCPALQVR